MKTTVQLLQYIKSFIQYKTSIDSGTTRDYTDYNREMISCQICEKVVKLKDVYSKFKYNYCDGKCLNEHRKRNWNE